MDGRTFGPYNDSMMALVDGEEEALLPLQAVVTEGRVVCCVQGVSSTSAW